MNRHILIIGLTLIATGAVAGEKNQRPDTPVAETFQEVMRLRTELSDFYEAPTVDAARQIRSRWQDLPADVRRRIDDRHPGTGLRILSLESEVEVPKPETTTNTVTQVPAPATPPPPADPWNTKPATEASDPWKSPATRRPTVVVQYRDELDVFGNRPRHRR